jgi:hypothetical protein
MGVGRDSQGDVRADCCRAHPTEDRTDFVREAVERELQRREAEQTGKKPSQKSKSP